MSEVNNEKPKVTRRSSLKSRRINVTPTPVTGAVKKNGKRSSISWGQIDTFEFKEMKPTFQENTEIEKEKTKEAEERHKKFLENRRRSISNEFISEKDMMKVCTNFIDELFEEEENKLKKKDLEKINEAQDSYSSSKNEDYKKKAKRKVSSSSSDSSSSKSSCSCSNCSFRREFNKRKNENKMDEESDKKVEKKEIKSPKPEKKKENNKTIKFKIKENENEMEKKKMKEKEKEKEEEKIVIKKNKTVEKKNEGKKVLKEKIIKKEEKLANKKEKQKKEETKKKEEELGKRKEEPENKNKNEPNEKIMSEFRASNKVRLISYKEARELDLDTVAYIVLTDGSVLVVRKEYDSQKVILNKKKMNSKTINNNKKRIINKSYQTFNHNNNMQQPIQMSEIPEPNFKKIIFQNEIQDQPIPSIYPKQNINFNTQIFPNNNISFLAQNYKKNFKKINNNLSLKLNKLSISPSFKIEKDKKAFNFFSPKNMAKKRYINHNYAQSLKNISQSNNHPQFRKFIKISPQREEQPNRYTIINAIPYYDDNSNQMLDNSQVNAESALYPDLGDSDTNLSQYNRYKTMKQPKFIYSPIKCNINENNYNSNDQLNVNI